MSMQETPEQRRQRQMLEGQFGNQRGNQRGGLFGGGITYNGQPTGQPQPTGATGPFGGGLSIGNTPSQPTEQKQGGGGSRRWAGILADTLLGLGGQGPVYAPMAARDRMMQEQMARQQQMAKQSREWGNQDWMQRQEYQRANPEPRAPDAFDTALARGGIDPNSEEGRAMYRQRAESLSRDPNDEFVVVPIPGRGSYVGPRSGLAQAYGQPAQQQGYDELPEGYSIRQGDATGNRSGGF